MKVLLVNGSPHEAGCTAAALAEVERALHEENIDTERFFTGNKPVADCIGCGKCRELGRCVFDDVVNELSAKAASCDGFIFGSPVYYAHPSARLLAVMDRVLCQGKAYLFWKRCWAGREEACFVQ